MVIPCLKLRDELALNLKQQVSALKGQGITPYLAIILIGNDISSETYIRVKSKKAKELGIETKIFRFNKPDISVNQPDASISQPDTSSQPVTPVVPVKTEILNKENDKKNNIINNLKAEVEKLIFELNQNQNIDGIIIQRPLPKPLNSLEDYFQELIDPKKDVDGLSKNSPFINPLVLAVKHAVKYALSQNFLSSPTNLLNTVVVGKGKSGGAPIYKYFASQQVLDSFPDYHFKTFLVDTKTPNPTEVLKQADIIISCVGKPKIINASNIKKGAVLASVGQHQDKISNKWTGDYDENEIAPIAGAYTKTPGGIGPLNVIFLLQNIINAVKLNR